MKEFYDRFWKKTTAELADFRYKWPILRRFIPHTKCILLDYGCGKGKILGEIQKQNPNLILFGADISEIARKSTRNAVPKATILSIDNNQHIPVRNTFFDFVISLDVIEHIYDTEKVFDEFKRIIKKDGRILLSTPYYGLIKNIIIALIGFDIVYEPTSPHIRFYTKKSLISTVKQHGFSILKFGYYGRFPFVWRGMYVLAKKN